MSPARKRFRSKIPAITINTIKDRKVLLNVSALEELEARNSLRIERDHLTVEN
jgi:hypothetical protein